MSDPSVPAQYSKGHVDPLPDEDTAKPTISFYSTADSPGHTFNLAYFPPPLEAALTATTTINILKPGKSIWPSNPPPVPGDGNDDGIVDIQDLTNLLFHWQQPVTGGASDGDINGDGFVDIQDMSILQNHWQQSRNPAYFQVALTQAGLSQVEEGVLQVAPPIAWTTMLPSPIPSPYNGNLGYVGEVSWVQLVNCWNWSGNALFRHPALTTDGTYMLDNTYPYNDTPGANNDSDAPSIASRWGDDELSITQNCEDWLMWRPPGGGSIPVPIQYFQWGVYANGVWVGDHWIPTTAHIGPYYEGGVNTDGMPQWDAKLVNTDHSGEG